MMTRIWRLVYRLEGKRIVRYVTMSQEDLDKYLCDIDADGMIIGTPA